MTIFTKNYRKLKLRNSTFWFFLVTSIFTSFARAETNLQETHADTPKYVPGVESIAHAHQYIQKNEALLYWQISPYYLPQLTDSSCSLASATMIVNAARNSENLTVNQPCRLDKRCQRGWRRRNVGPISYLYGQSIRSVWSA